MESEFHDQITSFTGRVSLISTEQEVRWSQSLSGYNGIENILDLQELPYILKSNPHPNLIHTQFLAIS